ncbi:MAG: HAMP domain-containing histidine kinase [Ardenticatenaceae bacterium]|nr:HAMP domain-containing histidine kinase [Ardenticatenaceae bacterium]
MFKTLRSRLLLSYSLLVTITLFVVSFALIALGAQPRLRFQPALQRLDIISRAGRNDIIRLQLSSSDIESFLRGLVQTLEDTAETNNVRAFIARARTAEIIFDTDPSDSMVGVRIEGTELPRDDLPTTDPNTLAARFEDPDGNRWLVYTRAISSSGFGDWVVVYAIPEPRPLTLLRELGFGAAFVRAGTAGLLVSVLLAWLITRSVARPLLRMAGAAEAIAQGEYEQQLPLEGPEEVVRVAESFNSMSAQVAATRQAQRDFVANVSHDLKTPITSIQGWSQALLDGTAVSPEDQAQAATIIYGEAERMGRMVAQLLDLAKIESGQLELNRAPLSLADVCTAVYQNLLPRAQTHQIHLTLETEPAPPIWGDYDRLMQVVSNLVENGLNHTAAGGRVHMSVRPYGAKAVELTVQDNGKGMPPEQLERIFERFYQVDKSRVRTDGQRGSGLGLSIVQELVLLHNGRIQARSKVGEGSQFIVRLPTAQTPEPSTILRTK